MRVKLTVILVGFLLAACSGQAAEIPTQMVLPTAPPTESPVPATPAATLTLVPSETFTETPLLNVTLTREAINALRTQMAAGTMTVTSTPPPAPEATLEILPIAFAPEIITLNQPLTVSVDESGPVELTYAAYGGEVVSIVARSLQPPGELDPLVQILDSSGFPLATSDDHRSARATLYKLDAAIDDLLLESSGDYTIRVSTQTNPGSIEVTISGTIPPTETPEGYYEEPTDEYFPDDDYPVEPTAGSITQVIAGQFETGQVYRYVFPALEGEYVTITVRDTSNTFDPLVTLIDAEGFVVDENDQHASDFPGLDENDAAIEQAYIAYSGNHTIEVSDYFQEASGTFEMTIIRESF